MSPLYVWMPEWLRERSAKPFFVGSNPTPDSTPILFIMNRELRRENTKRKWLSRAKKVYKSCGEFHVPSGGLKARVPWFVLGYQRKCESITDFLDNSMYAKMLRNCTVPYRSKSLQFEYKKENRKNRRSARKEIIDGIQEYEQEGHSCISCIFYEGGLCEKDLLLKDNCLEYWD